MVTFGLGAVRSRVLLVRTGRQRLALHRNPAGARQAPEDVNSTRKTNHSAMKHRSSGALATAAVGRIS